MRDLLGRLSAIRKERPRAGERSIAAASVHTSSHTQEPDGPLTLEGRARAKGLDIDDVVERAAIMEYDGGVPRGVAEQYALGDLILSDDDLRRLSRGVRL